MQWQCIDTGRRTAAENMELDAALLDDLGTEDEAILHLYDWTHDAATYGRFVHPLTFLRKEGIEKRRIDLARRPTGGGIIFHTCDLAFSVLVPASSSAFSLNPLDNYAFVNRRIMRVLTEVMPHLTTLLSTDPLPIDVACTTFCMAKPTKFDVMVGEKKIGGAAQRMTRAGFLHQGSIAIAEMPEEFLAEVLLEGSLVGEAMRKNSFYLLPASRTRAELDEMRTLLRSLLQKVFSTTYKE